MSTTTTTNTVLLDIQAALQGAETVLPTLLGIVGAFYTPAQALTPFLPLLQVALNTVAQVEAVLAGDTAGAVTAVTSALQGVPATVQPATPSAPSTPITPAN